MPDYPFTYAEGPVRAVEPGGTRVRVLRRRPRQQTESRAREQGSPLRETQWREELEGAVDELNAAFEDAGAPYVCELLEDDAGFVLRVSTAGSPPGAAEPIEEILEAADLPAWVSRLRAHLGILVDRQV